MTTVPKHRYGGARALVLLHDQHMREFIETWKRARAAGVVLPQSPDPNYASMEHLLFHVMRAGRGYMTWMCECLELPAPDIRPTPDVAALSSVLDEYVEHLLEGWKTPLVDVPEGSLGSEVLKLRAWAEEQATRGGTGDKDSAPKHTDRVWRQVSVNHRECLGAARCRFADECFAERAKDRAARSQLVVTNHSLLAIDAVEGVPVIPEYDVVVIDEAHEIVARVTQAATD